MEEGNNDNAQEQSQESTPSWFYSAPTEDNAGVAGAGETPPEWLNVSKYKSVEEQAKAYPEAASRLGGFESAPEEYTLPEGFDDDTIDAGLVDIVKGLGKEYNMGQTMFNDLMGKVNDYQNDIADKSKESAMEALGENAEGRIQEVNNWLNSNAPKEIVETIAPMAESAEAIEALEFFISKSKSSKMADANAVQADKVSQAEYADKLMAKDSHGNLKISIDPAYKAEMDKLTAQMQQG